MKIIAGVDEVGRGSLIGPVYAAAVILNKRIDKKLLKDSKTISKDKRELLSKYIKKNSIWVISKASVKEIDKINILQASLLAMKRAIKKLKKKPSHVLIDGNKLPDLENLKNPLFVRMTGSGSVIIAYYQSKKDCEMAKVQFKRKYLSLIHI